MSSNPTFITTAEVAERAGFPSAIAFNAKREVLERDHGFPEPMPCLSRPRRWRADQVDAWIERNGRPRDTETARPSGPNVVLFEMAGTA